MSTLTRQDLDAVRCRVAGCQHDHGVLYFHGSCHPNSPVWACYEKQTGEIVIRCGKCEQLIARVAVAGGTL
jgi:hypothetical protein